MHIFSEGHSAGWSKQKTIKMFQEKKFTVSFFHQLLENSYFASDQPPTRLATGSDPIFNSPIGNSLGELQQTALYHFI